MLIDGKNIADSILGEIKEEVRNINGRKPCVAFILVGKDPASKIYIRRKAAACEFVGIKSIRTELRESTDENTLLQELDKLNNDSHVDGILVQLPLPKHISASHVISSINPEKDVDGFHPLNMGKLLVGDPTGFCPCTPLGIKELLIRSQVPIESQHVVIVGRSNIVGKPLAALLMQNKPDANATVTVVHSKTKDLKKLTKEADILIAAMGVPKFITSNMVKHSAVVIDVGISKIEDKSAPSAYCLVGDVDFEHVQKIASKITPVPGGVGPMTIAMLLANTVRSRHMKE